MAAKRQPAVLVTDLTVGVWTLDQPDSFLADCLSKFHMASEAIQALWILASVATLLAVTWRAARAAVEIATIRHGADGRYERPFASSDASARFIESTAVMPGLDPGAHALTQARQERRGWPGQARP
jgi:hypothetical protein